MVRLLLLLSLCVAASCQNVPPAPALSSVTRAEVLATAEAYRTHRWRAGDANAKHGLDADGVRVDTPTRGSGSTVSGRDTGRRRVGMWGVPYQWVASARWRSSMRACARGVRRRRLHGREAEDAR